MEQNVPESNFYSFTRCQSTDEIATANVDNEIEIPIINKSQFISDFNEFFASFTQRIASLRLNDKTNNTIYSLCHELVEHTQSFNMGLIDDGDDADSKQILRISSEYILEKIDQCSTTYRRNKNREKNHQFIPPKEMSLGLKWEMLRDAKTKIAVPQLTQCKFQYISIVDTLQSLFQRKDFQKVYFDYNSDLHDHICVEGVFKDVCCGEMFKTNRLYQSDPSAIRIQISNDDFEVCNPLGSKATVHKLSAYYFVIQNLPPQFRSKTDNIFLFCLCYSDDLKTEYTDINDVWYLLCKDIIHLETNGISAECGKTVRGTISLMSFDNLGANSTLGFVSSFQAHHFCRICEMAKTDCRKECRENLLKRRSIESYNNILVCIENSTKIDLKDTIGIKMKCTLNDLQYFHILKNLSVDPMHDLNEGVVPFALRELFSDFIRLKIMSEKGLQQKFQFFDYGFLNQRNVPSAITLDKSNLGQNATQIGCLLQHLPFILWEYRDRVELSDMWLCIKSLLRSFMMCYSTEITKTQVESLREEIYKHLTCLTNRGLSLIPKHHMFTHYPTIICEMGPVYHMCMFKFERKHKWLKSLMNDNCNFKNITKTIARKHQEHLCEVKDSFTEKYVSGHITNMLKSSVEVYTELFTEHTIDINYVKDEVHFLKYCNYFYKKGLIVFHQSNLLEILHILLINERYYFICALLDVLHFDDFLNSFEIRNKSQPLHKIIDFSHMVHKNVYEKKLLGNHSYIICDSLVLLNKLQPVLHAVPY